jgi:hypothetical protein
MSAHTPGKWVAVKVDSAPPTWQIRVEGTLDGPLAHIRVHWQIALVGCQPGDLPETPAANAELICRAVNAHADLLAACEAARHALTVARQNVADVGGDRCEEVKFFNQPIRQVSAAIARARGGDVGRGREGV